MPLCNYGCKHEGRFQFANGKVCCSMSVSQCPNIRKKIGQAHADGRCSTKQLTHEVCACNKGKVFTPDEEIFCKGITTSPSYIKTALLARNKVEYKCVICQCTSWQNHPISLELDHIDGDRTNNSLENLRLLCPNCHSQTATFRGKNIAGHGGVKVPDDVLLNMLYSTHNIREALIKTGLAASGGNYIRAKKLLALRK